MKYIRPLMLVCFALLCIGSFYFTLSYFEQRKPLKTPIRIIAQTGPIKEGLKTDYLAEILDLSINDPKYLDVDEVEKIIGKSPLIKKVSASYLNSETLYIDYTLRNPTFALIDLENTALDFDGHLFPLSPYFTPKKLPELYLGLKEVVSFDEPLKGRKMILAIDLYNLLKEEIKRIDLSHLNEKSLGKREIVIILEYAENVTHTLRLSPKRYKEELDHYLDFKKNVQDQGLIIDLRVPDLAYIISEGKKSSL
ncbi:MAG: hypothetical protein KFB93_04005 [Simkaniaceae bacterium]|nr:MAG: hypothetical protein KFB93_04005 [Simkaniaceae bacterium]